MDEQQGYSGFAPSAYGTAAPYVPAPVPPLAPPPQFRPLNTGEILDRTFALYRQRFWLFVGIGMLPAGVLLITSSMRLLYQALTHQTSAFAPFPAPGAAQPALSQVMSSMALLYLTLFPASILFLVAYGISHAAVVDAVNRLGESAAVTVRSTYDAVRGRWLRWCGIVLRQFWSLGWPMIPGVILVFVSVGLLARPGTRNNFALIGSVMVLGWVVITAGVVLGIMNYVRNTLAIAAGASEDLGVNASLRRSKALVAGRKGRIFLALLLIYALQMVVGAVQLPLLFAAMALRGGAFVAVQAVAMLVQFAAVALVSPVASIAFTLFYIDERVRREGFDIEVLMRRTLPMAPATQPAYVPEI